MPKRDRLATTARQVEALQLRARGLPYEAIGQTLGITKQAAHKLVSRALDATVQEAAGQVRQLELHRLDELLTAATDVLQRDDGPTLAAINTLLKIMERRAKLEGLDAPARVDAKVDGTLTTMDAIDQEVVRLEQELADLDPSYLASKQRERAAARDLAAFRTRWRQPDHRPVVDPAGFVADALEMALGQLGLDPDEQEQTVAAVEQLMWARSR